MILGNIDAPLEPELTPNTSRAEQEAKFSAGPFSVNREQVASQVESLRDESSFVDSFNSAIDTTSAYFNYTKDIVTEVGRENVLKDKIKADYFKLRENGLVTPEMEAIINSTKGITLSTMFDGVDTKNPYDNYLDYIQQNPQYVADIQQRHPELGIKTYEEIGQDVLDHFNDVTKQRNQAAQNTGMMNAVGSFIGTVGGLTSNPVDAAFTLAPLAAPGVGMLSTFARISGSAALSIAAQEAINKPGEVELRQLLGEDITAEQGLKEAATDVAIGAGLTGLLGTIGYAIGKAANPAVKQQLIDAQDIIKDTQDILKHKPADVPNAEFEQQVDTIFKEVAAGKEPGLAGLNIQTLSKSIEEETKVLSTLRDPAVAKTRFDEIYEKLKVQDEIITTTDDLGNTRDISTRAEFEAVATDKIAQEEILKCLMSGVVNVGT